MKHHTMHPNPIAGIFTPVLPSSRREEDIFFFFFKKKKRFFYIKILNYSCKNLDIYMYWNLFYPLVVFP
jgi:hypothetical protein